MVYFTRVRSTIKRIQMSQQRNNYGDEVEKVNNEEDIESKE